MVAIVLVFLYADHVSPGTHNLKKLQVLSITSAFRTQRCALSSGLRSFWCYFLRFLLWMPSACKEEWALRSAFGSPSQQSRSQVSARAAVPTYRVPRAAARLSWDPGPSDQAVARDRPPCRLQALRTLLRKAACTHSSGPCRKYTRRCYALARPASRCMQRTHATS